MDVCLETLRGGMQEASCPAHVIGSCVWIGDFALATLRRLISDDVSEAVDVTYADRVSWVLLRARQLFGLLLGSLCAL